MKTLYLSDLDGTLLCSDERVSEYTANIINHFVQNGGCFSYATARSITTASKVTNGLNTNFPVICGNGAFIFENTTHEMLKANYFTSEEIKYIREVLNYHGFYPMVSTYINGTEHKTYILQFLTNAMKCFLNNRIGDPRCHEVKNADELYSGNIYRFACMDTDNSLSPINDIFKTDTRFSCIYQKELYSGECWCDILTAKATKANAALHLKSMLGCDKLVVFGDERNDLSLFSVADEKYATFNAVSELKEIATAVIDSNDNDGVAKWIEKNVLTDCK